MDTIPFNFSITETLRHVWRLFRRHPLLYMGITAIMVLLNLPPAGTGVWHTASEIFVSIMSLIFSYMTLSVFLAAIDEKDTLLTFDALHLHLPTGYQLLMFLIVDILVALAVVAGVIVLVIPGIYVMIRLSLAQFAYVDRRGNARSALQFTWRLVTKDVFWTVFLTCIVAVGLLICGAAFLGIGLLVTYPLAMMLMASLYRALTGRTLAVQPDQYTEPGL